MKLVNFDTYFSANGGGKTLDISWQEACEMFRVPKAHLAVPYMQKPENDTDGNYKAWKEQVDNAKKNAGYVFWGETKNGRKAKKDIVNHSAIAIDYDGMENKEFVPSPKNVNYLLYSTTKHVASDPHYRLIIPLDRPVVGDEYIALCRMVLAEVGMDGVDACTLQDNRAMGYTVLLQGSDYVYKAVTDRDALHVDNYLKDGWQDASTWPLLQGEKVAVKQATARVASGDKFVAPTDLKGYVGAMCTAYSISKGIETFLKDVYVPAGKNRFTFVGGSSVGGLYVIDDAVCISYHSTDPANDGKVHNIYELVAIHTGYGKRQMSELCKRDADIMRVFRGVAPTAMAVPEYAREWGNLLSYPANDWGIAKRLRDAYAGCVGWATDAKCWLYYDGTRWADVDVSVMHGLFERIAEIMQAIAGQVADSKDVESIAKIIFYCQNSHYRDSALKALKPMVQLVRGDMDGDQWGMNTTTGYLRLTVDGEYLVPNSYTQHCCKRADAGFTKDFVPDKECTKFLESVLPDVDVRHWMQKFLGYCMSGSTREKLGVFLHAPANNGKTTFINLVKNAFGDYCETGDDKLITTSRYGGDANAPTPSLASLAGARICLFDEIRAGKKIESGAWKQLTGASPMKARKLRQDPFQFVPRFKMLISCNDVPLVEDAHDPAMKIRIRIVPFTATFKGKAVDKSIEDKIHTESWKNTFLYWVFEGLQYYLIEGLDDYGIGMNVAQSNMPKLMQEEFKRYFKDADEVGDFVTTYCEITGNKRDFVSFNSLFDRYLKENRNSYADSKRAFGIKLRKFMESVGCTDDRRMVGNQYNKSLQRGYCGIRWYSEVEADKEFHGKYVEDNKIVIKEMPQTVENVVANVVEQDVFEESDVNGIL